MTNVHAPRSGKGPLSLGCNWAGVKVEVTVTVKVKATARGQVGVKGAGGGRGGGVGVIRSADHLVIFR